MSNTFHTRKSPEDATLARIRDAVLSVTPARAVYLFGSRARGDHRPDSDYDVLVVTWKTPDDRVLDTAIRERLNGLRVDLKIVSAERFEWRKRFANTVERAADREGIVLAMTTEHDDRRSMANEWFENARIDLDGAHDLSNREKYAALICFHVQQSVEKNLKGFLTLDDVDAPRTHQIGDLLSMCVEIDESFAAWNDSLPKLTEYAVQTRYSSDKPGSEEVNAALELGAAFQAFIDALLAPEQDLNR
ncbi:MAG: HEPN domain-containing protein [Candidatus Poribacteria bacterium]|nr:HEPN domain-containing protein [Candidatus Poribacteria bacterium]